MKCKYIGAAISDSTIVGVELVNKKGEFSVVDIFHMKRKGSLRDDCHRFITQFSLDGQRIGVAAISERRDKVLVTPSLSRFETAELLKWQISDYVDWPESYYFFDFVTEAPLPDMVMQSDIEQQLVFLVALPKQIINDVATGILSGHGNLEIIDFFPGALTRRYVEHNGSVIALIKTDTIELTGWSRHMCLAKCEVAKDFIKVKEGLEQIETDLYTYGVPGIAGIASFAMNDESKKSNESNESNGRKKSNESDERNESNGTVPDQAIQELFASYGELTPIYCDVSKVGQEVALHMAQELPLLWNMAMGLAIRGLYKPSY